MNIHILAWIVGGLVVLYIVTLVCQALGIGRVIRKVFTSGATYWEEEDTLNGIPKEMREKMEREKLAPKGCLCVGGAEGIHDRECPRAMLDDRRPEL